MNKETDNRPYTHVIWVNTFCCVMYHSLEDAEIGKKQWQRYSNKELMIEEIKTK